MKKNRNSQINSFFFKLGSAFNLSRLFPLKEENFLPNKFVESDREAFSSDLKQIGKDFNEVLPKK